MNKAKLLRSVLHLLVTYNMVPSSPILLTLIMDAKRSSVTSGLTSAARRHIPEVGILRDKAALCSGSRSQDIHILGTRLRLEASGTHWTGAGVDAGVHLVAVAERNSRMTREWTALLCHAIRDCHHVNVSSLVSTTVFLSLAYLR
jgi:hypothetical protein